MVTPKYQLFPPLSDEEFQALKADIAQQGILIPVEIDEAGNILDGHHRVRAWEELRIEGIKVPDYPRLIRANLTEPQKLNHVRTLNLLRRHLTNDQQKPHWGEMRKAGMTYPAIAEVSGVSDESVRLALSETKNLESEITNVRGQKRPSHYKPRQPKTISALNQKDTEVALRAIKQAGDALPDKPITTKRAARIGREQDNARRRQDQESKPIIPTNDIDLRAGDFREALKNIPPGTVDLICTDPPYGKDYLELWTALSIFANTVLKPGGWLVAYCGQSHLKDHILNLSANLQYVWVIAQINGASKKTIAHEPHIYSQWKPILLFAKPPVSPLNWVNDTLTGGGREKELHDWQQSEAEAVYYIQNFSPLGGLVIDPFLGAGTVAMAAKGLGRHFIGCDIDAACISKTLERINEPN